MLISCVSWTISNDCHLGSCQCTRRTAQDLYQIEMQLHSFVTWQKHDEDCRSCSAVKWSTSKTQRRSKVFLLGCSSRFSCETFTRVVLRDCWINQYRITSHYDRESALNASYAFLFFPVRPKWRKCGRMCPKEMWGKSRRSKLKMGD